MKHSLSSPSSSNQPEGGIRPRLHRIRAAWPSHSPLSAAGQIAMRMKHRPLTPQEETPLMSVLQRAKKACDAEPILCMT